MLGAWAPALLALAVTAPVMAEPYLPPPGPAPPPQWTVTLGAEGRVAPSFEGSSRYVPYLFPLFGVRRAGTPPAFSAPRDGFGYALVDSGHFRFGLVGNLKLPRSESQDGSLRGLGDVGLTVEVGAFLEFWALPWLRARAEVRQGFGGHHGVVADLTGDVVLAITGQLTLSAGPRLSLATSRALGPYFGIDPGQSLASGLPAYDAKGGLRSLGIGAKARYQWTPVWATYVFIEYERLVGGSAESPLVRQRGSPDQATFGLGATYSFDIRW